MTASTGSTDPGAFCGHCGGDVAGGDHRTCAERLRMEPPRYCIRCARRMKVQVSPTSWSAECVEHGVLASA